MLPTGNVVERNAAFHQVLCSSGLQTLVQFLVQMEQAVVILACLTDNASSGIQYSLQLIGDRHGRLSENGIAAIYTQCHEGVN